MSPAFLRLLAVASTEEKKRENIMGFLDTFGGSVVGSAASGAIGVLGDIAVGAINRKWQKEQYATEKADEAARYQRQRQDYLADLENERQFNSAAGQIDRLREAGLNPNLMGSTSLSAGQSSLAAPMGNVGPTSESAKVGSSLASGMISASMNDSLRRLNDAKGDEAKAIANLQSELGVSEREFRPVKKALIQAQTAESNGNASLAYAKVDEALAHALKLEEETYTSFIDNQTRSRLNNIVIDELESRKKKNNSDALVNGLIAAYKKCENDWQKTQYWVNTLFKTSFMFANIGGTIGDFLKIFKKKASGLTLPKESGKPDTSLPTYLEEMFPEMTITTDF